MRMSCTSFPIRNANSSSDAAYELEPSDSLRSAYQGPATGGTDDSTLHLFTADRSKSDPSKNIRRPSKKGTRSKSGCHTCRIRRKKCDENRDKRGQCETCVRLHLQCLGFGDRRPDWLKDVEIVNNIRKKIKAFLGSQGLIKGSFLPHDKQPVRDFLWLYEEGHHHNAPTENEGPAATQPYSPPLHHPSNSMAITAEPIDASGNYDDMWQRYNDSVLRFPHQTPPNGYRLRHGATHYSADSLFGLKQEQDISLDSLGLEPDSDSQYSFRSGSTSTYSVDGDHGLVSVSAEPGMGDVRYRYSHRRVTNNNTSDHGQMLLPGNSQSSIGGFLL